MNTILGTCSVCGGPVQVPTVWHGIVPPTPSCGRCGATPANQYGPVIEMSSTRHSPPATKTTLCSCFHGTCRGGEVIGGQLANGQVCKGGDWHGR